MTSAEPGSERQAGSCAPSGFRTPVATMPSFRGDVDSLLCTSEPVS